jgi:ribonuclease HI
VPKNKFYVVWKGRKPGIYASWEECQKQIIHFKDPRYKGFRNRQQAEAAFADATLNEGTQALIQDSWSVDAACEGNPGIMEYQCVDTATRKVIFHKGPFPKATNNIGEFLAIVHAMALQQRREISLPVYTDSRTALSWIKKKRALTKLPRDASTEEIWELLDRAEAWLLKHDIHVAVLKWQTERWGENPADFGRK